METADLSLALNDELAGAIDRPAMIDPLTAIWRFSYLKKFALSAAHARQAVQEADDDTLALRLGSGTHAMLFDQPVALYTGRRDPRIKAWSEFEAEQEARGCTTILNPKEWAEAKTMCDAVRRNRTAERLLFDDTVREQTITWQFLGQIACRSTPDARGKNHLVDVKTARIAKPSAFMWQAIKLYYHAQLAFYGHAVEQTFGRDPAEMYIVAVEKTAPYPVVVFRLTERTIVQGQKLVRNWAEDLISSLLSDQWPEYSEAIIDFDIPDDPADEPFEVEVDGRLVRT